jgi:Protein of unknown function (DUF2892)
MKTNIGSIDRAIRALIAITLITLFYTETITGTWGIVLIVVSFVFLLTSMISFCPLYLPFGLSTVKKKRAHR